MTKKLKNKNKKMMYKSSFVLQVLIWYSSVFTKLYASTMLDQAQVQETVKQVNELTQQQHAFEMKMYMLAAVLFFLIIIFGVLCFIRHKNTNTLRKIIEILEARLKEQSNESTTDDKNIDIDNAVIEDILENLRIFEQNSGFLTSKITLHEFAKSLETNTKYLSKIINTYKFKSFRNYINDLRIEYGVSQLKTCAAYRNFTIKAMASEFGFATKESFTNAFKKYTGTTVSNYVSALESNQHEE